MVHVSPWEATLGLLAGAARVLPRGGPLVLYGPYRRDGVPTAASNEAFDARSEEHTSELQSLMRISYAVFCLKKKKTTHYGSKQEHKQHSIQNTLQYQQHTASYDRTNIQRL